MERSLRGRQWRHAATLFNEGAVGDLSDGQLLARFLTCNAESSELAFQSLVERHGPMVLRVCRAVLRDPHDAEDAFQTTFLVLARRADSIRARDSVASWLHGVAYRTGCCARASAARRRAHERRAAETTAIGVTEKAPTDTSAVLHEELNRLPERYRHPLVLCYLEGLTHEQAARLLGLPLGTVRSRLARGRDRLRQHLTRRGLDSTVGIFAAYHGNTASPTVPAALSGILGRTAVRFGARETAAGVSSTVIWLTEGVLRTMFVTKIKPIAATALAGITMATAAILFGQVTLGSQPPAPGEPRAHAPSVVEPAAQGNAPPPAEEALAKSREEVARRIRDDMYRGFTGGEVNLDAYLEWQSRYNSTALALVRTDAQRIRFFEATVRGMKSLHEVVERMSTSGQASQTDVRKVEYFLLDAEVALAEARRVAPNAP